MGFRRDVSHLERIFLAAEPLAHPLAVQVFVEGDGPMDPRRLREAVAAAGEACPGTRLVERGHSWIDTGTPPPVYVIDGAGFDGQRFELPALQRRFDPRRGPTCEVLLLDGPRPTLVFRAFHGVMDGKGALLWMKDVFRALRGEPLAGAPDPETDDGLLRRIGSVGSRPRAEPRYTSPLGGTHLDATGFFFQRRTLDGRWPALVARLAAILAAESSEDTTPRRFMIPVDGRRHDAQLRTTANLSFPLFLDVQPGEPWEALHERLLAALAARGELTIDDNEGLIRRLPRFLVTALLRLFLRSQRRGRHGATAVLSHLGRVAPADYSDAWFSARSVYALPVHGQLTPLDLVAVERAGHVELTLCGTTGDGQAERAAALLDRIARALAPIPARVGRATSTPFHPDNTVTRRFMAQAQRTPDAVALVCGERALSYAELDRRAGAVACELADRGVGPGALVGLMADRTPEAVIGIFGVLRAGAAYLPIDPLYPDERVAFMLADVNAQLCLAAPRHRARVTGLFAGTTLDLDALVASTAPPLAPVGSTHDLAYVMYTSGSTGRPKGVQIEHIALLNYLQWATRLYDIDARTRCALFTSLSFDLTVTALFLPLLAGGSVALFPGDLDHLLLEQMLGASGCDTLRLTPTHLDFIGRLGLRPTGFRRIILGGELLRTAVAARTQDLFGPDCRIINEYGPTEATVGCVVHFFDPARDDTGPAVAIGRPGDNTEIRLLDADRRPVETGEVGEIYIAGECLSRGYVGRPDLNHERFVTLDDGTRAYRSGDLAILRPDGVLEFCGRTDNQVKIRGHRIEPGEIEVVLERHPSVARAVVEARTRPGQAEKVLCAFVLTRGAFDAAALRVHLEASLPRPLVPAHFIAVDDIPLTAHGKVDSRALPDPFADSTDAGSSSVLDLDERQRAVAAIWARLLHVDADSLGPGADFHRLGGDSLTLLEMLSSVARHFFQGRAEEEAFLSAARRVLARPTLDAVCRAVAATGAHDPT